MANRWTPRLGNECGYEREVFRGRIRLEQRIGCYRQRQASPDDSGRATQKELRIIFWALWDQLAADESFRS